MAELARRLNNRDRVLQCLQARGKVLNVDLVKIGGMRAMARVWDLQKEHVIDVTHEHAGIWLITYRGPRVPTQTSINWELAS